MTFTHPGDGNWYRYSFTFNLPAAAVTSKKSGVGLNLHIAMACTNSATFQTATPNTWITHTAPKLTAVGDVDWWSSTSNYLDLAQVQLEPGTQATPFEFRPYGTELALCQRYYYTINSVAANGSYLRFGIGAVRNTTLAECTIHLPVKMRNVPTFSSTAANTFIIYATEVITTATGLAIGADGCSDTVVTLSCGAASGLTAGQAFALMAFTNNTSFIAFSAEL
jgi:hypothetical protein